MAHRWRRVSARHPCPICGKPDNCEVSQDGTAAWCGRISSGSSRENAGGQFLHRLQESWQAAPPAALPENPRPKRDFAAVAERLARYADAPRLELARLLGVEASALSDLGVGWNGTEQWWSFPERNAHGKVSGISARFRNGDKRRLTGGKAGLTYTPNWAAGHAPILLVEGGSDTAALVSIGLNVVGRPSNTGGVNLLIELLADTLSDREIIVIGERDQKPDGRWPGKDGAVRTAQKLSEALERTVEWAFPPDDAKDSREWLRKMRSLPQERLAALFLDGLDLTVVEPPPLFTYEPDTSPPVSLADWRKEMHRARRASFSRPGYYLDRSTTGAGKSTVDLEVILQVLRTEAA